MIVITWNLQWGLGLDGRVDAARALTTARAMGDFDVLCVQEVADNFPALEGNDDRDQFAQLSGLLPGYVRVEGFAVDVAAQGGRRRRFGNAIFSRLPVHSARRHALPWPADAKIAGMPRVAVEATLASPFGPLRVTTTHLEYYSEVQRQAQAIRLRELHEEACARALSPGKPLAEGGPFDTTPQTANAILTGDLNFPPEHPAYAEIQRAVPSGDFAYRDAWTVAHGAATHAPTFCVHSRQYSKAPYCCDFAFVSTPLAARVRRVEVQGATRDSDHQPVLVELG